MNLVSAPCKRGICLEFVIISGMSGAGKSKAATFMEDMGFFCVDNLPVPLITKFAELGMAGGEEYNRLVMVTDVRSGTNFDRLFQTFEELEKMDCPYKILFMDAADDTIIKRYKETRRSHPLAGECGGLEQSIEEERRRMAQLKERADHIVDTSELPTAKLKGELLRLFGKGQKTERMVVSVSSFGFKHGLPRAADLVFDVRFLPNPHYVSHLRPQTGLDAPVRDYVYASPQTGEFLKRLKDLVDFLLPRYEEEGKTELIIAVGCTGGHHRSVAIAHDLAQHIRSCGFLTEETHRDLGRK